LVYQNPGEGFPRAPEINYLVRRTTAGVGERERLRIRARWIHCFKLGGVTFMKATRFPTDLRLWNWIALAVLAASWCIPVISIKSGPYFSIATALKELVAAIHRQDDSATLLFRRVFIVFASASVVVAIVIGWLLHCLVVIVRARRRERTEHAA